MPSINTFRKIVGIAAIGIISNTSAMTESTDAYHQSIVANIYKSPWAKQDPIVKKIKQVAPSYTYYEINSNKEVVVRGFWIKNPFNTTPPEDYYVFQHDMSVDRGSDRTYWNPKISCNEADHIVVERRHCSIWLDKSWLRTESMSIGIIDAERISEIQRIVLSHLKTNKNGITTEENALGAKPTGKEYTRISHVVHILEESFAQPAKVVGAIAAQTPQNKTEQSNTSALVTQQPVSPTLSAINQEPVQQFVVAKRFWQQRFFWQTVGVACFVGGLFAYRSPLCNFLSQLRSLKS